MVWTALINYVHLRPLIISFHLLQGEHLNITPADSLEFVVMDFQKETLDIINLKNCTDDLVTYKVKTTAPEKYRVRPSTGECIEAEIILNASRYFLASL